MCSVDPLNGCIGIVKEIWPCVCDCVCYKKILHENMATLTEAMKKLSYREDHVNKEIKDTTTHGESWRGKKRTTRKEVKNWLENVQDRRSEVEDIKSKAKEKRHFTRWQFLRLVEKKIEVINGLIRDGDNFRGEAIFMYVDQDPELELATTTLVGQSTEEIKKTILDRVKTGTCIGVWGMGGSGKTTIVTHVHDELLKNKDTFGPIYWVTVSEDSNIHKLQDQIANELNLTDFPKEEEPRRRGKLSEELKKKNKFVLILDDMWEAFPPEDVGIPIGVDAGKLILTSRSSEVCNRMNCQRPIIEVKPLADKEAWDLFVAKHGRVAALTPEEKECAESIVKECNGLPLAIITVARSTNIVNGIHGWTTALREFKNCTKGFNEMKDKAMKRLMFSYDRLNDEKLKQCFLYCALFPEDYKIKREYLIMCWIAEGLVDEMETRRDEFDKGHCLLDKLENACLLECTRDYADGKCVKMHDFIREMALEITRAGGQFMVKAGKKLTDFPSEGNWSKNLERVSLMGCEIKRQPDSMSPECPELCTLILRSIKHFKEIPNSLFLHLKNLRVLDMSELNEVKLLPDSISDLKKLRALLLEGCENLRYVPSLAKLTELRALLLNGCFNLRDVPSLAKLTELRELNLLKTEIKELPHGLKKLVNLRSLILPFVTNDEQVKEISGLEQLEVLFVFFHYLHVFTSYVKTQHCHNQRMSRYLLHIEKLEVQTYYGRHYKPHCRQVHIRKRFLIREDLDPLVLLPTNMQEFWIHDCEDLTSLSDISSCLKNTKELERLRIEDCGGIKQLWSWSNTDNSSLQSLRTLMLLLLKNLTVIFDIKGAGVGGCGTFSNLKFLVITRCNNLKYVLTHRLVQHHLQNLQVIHVVSCSKMENIIVTEEEEIVVAKEEEVTCPTLRRLELLNLLKLKSIWSGTMISPSLQLIDVKICPMLKRLPLSLDSQTSSTQLQISGGEEWWNLLEWDHPNAKSVFQHRFYPRSVSTADHFELLGGGPGPERIWKDDLKLYEEY